LMGGLGGIGCCSGSFQQLVILSARVINSALKALKLKKGNPHRVFITKWLKMVS
jgi:hypothetical protein